MTGAHSPIIVVLAGGRATRMGGGDKALRPLGGITLLDHVLARLAGQGQRMVLSANGDPTRFARFGLPVLADTVPGQPGPLAGVLAGMEWAAIHAPDVPDLVSVPADTPFLPRDLVARLLAGRAAADAELACAASLGQLHPVVGLWPVRLAPMLRAALEQEALRRVTAWTDRFPLARVSFAAAPVDPFFNVNRPEDLAQAEAMARGPLVLSVSSDAEHGFSKPARDSIRLLAGLGVEGDAHLGATVQHRSRVKRDPSQPNLRQVHLVHAELHDELRAAGFRIAPGTMGENVTTRGIDLLALPRGARLHLGETAVVEVTGLRNPCLQLDAYQPGLMAAVLGRDAAGGLVRKAGIMGIVLAGGPVRPGDRIRVVPPAEPFQPLGVV